LAQQYLPVSAPSVIEGMVRDGGGSVLRTKTSDRSMIEASLAAEVVFAGSMNGRFAFPRFQNAFDGMFAIAKLVAMASCAGAPLSAIIGKIPFRTYAESAVPCVWELKGGVMRRMSEDSLDKEATFIDGIKVHYGEDWVLLLPDQTMPLIRIIAEAGNESTAGKLMKEYRDKVEIWKKESV